jgi:hypothetical protein
MATRLVIVATVALGMSMLSSRAHAEPQIVPVTVCGQGLQPNPGPGESAVPVIGELVADLDCSADPTSRAVNLNHAIALRLNGHRIIAGAEGVACNGGVGSRPCRIEGPGEILGATAGAIVVHYLKKTLDVRDVDIHDNAVGILPAMDTKVKLQNVAFHDNANAIGVAASPAWPTTVIGRNVTLTDNISGIIASKIALTRFVATGQQSLALDSDAPLGRIALHVGTLANNGIALSAPLDGVDLYAVGKVRASMVTCNRSFGPLGPWGVCVND